MTGGDPGPLVRQQHDQSEHDTHVHVILLVLSQDDNLQTALHLAAHIGHEDTIQLLLDKGATESIAGRDR